MGFLFGGSTTSNEERIDELEDTLSDIRDRNRDLERSLQRHRHRLDKAESCIETLTETLHEKFNLDTDGADNFSIVKDGVVEALDTRHVGWKRTENAIVKLLIPRTARVVHPVGSQKLRTDIAYVAEVYDYDEFEHIYDNTFKDDYSSAIYEQLHDSSLHDSSFTYTVGEVVTPNDELDKDVDVACASGIHFYATKGDAVNHYVPKY